MQKIIDWFGMGLFFGLGFMVAVGVLKLILFVLGKSDVPLLH